MSETLVRLEGAQELILEKLLEIGVYKNKSEVIRAGILELGKEYKMLGSAKELEQELLRKKLMKEEKEMKNKKYLTKEKALAKYK